MSSNDLYKKISWWSVENSPLLIVKDFFFYKRTKFLPLRRWINSERADPCPRIISSSRDLTCSDARPPRCWMQRRIWRLPRYSNPETQIKSSSRSRWSLCGFNSDHQFRRGTSSTWRKTHRKQSNKCRVDSALSFPLA